MGWRRWASRRCPVASSLALLGLVFAGSASLADFEAHLATHDSATRALQEWCTARHIGQGPIRAKVLGATSDDPPARMRRILDLGREDMLAMRNVRLTCGGKALSIAWNWYVPSRLTPAMNAALERSDAPFGAVVSPLRFRRERIDVTAGPAENCPNDTISTHRAVLRLPDGRPLAYVIECYTAANLNG